MSEPSSREGVQMEGSVSSATTTARSPLRPPQSPTAASWACFQAGCKYYIPITNYVPESWELCLRDDTEDKPVKDQSQGCVDVDDKTWDRYPMGSHYP